MASLFLPYTAIYSGENITCDSRTTYPVRPTSRTSTRVFFSQLFFLSVAVFSLFSGETAHRRLHHTGSPSPRERGRKKKREEEEEERGRKKKRREEEEEAERKGEEERKEEEEEEGRERKKKREEGRRRRGGKKKKQRSREGRKKKREEGRRRRSRVVKKLRRRRRSVSSEKREEGRKKSWKKNTCRCATDGSHITRDAAVARKIFSFYKA
ncbi:hypothetical protein ACLB2K_029121 [Fragaria x ananassa]